MPSLTFEMDLPKSSQSKLVVGRLIFKDQDHQAGIALSATSGALGYQYIESWNLKGKGPIPPLAFKVSTQRLWLPDVKGVEGSFYPISPFSVKVDKGVIRGDFGIHFDANVPGSAGCIVIRQQNHWDIFRDKIDAIRDPSLVLLVKYGVIKDERKD